MTSLLGVSAMASLQSAIFFKQRSCICSRVWSKVFGCTVSCRGRNFRCTYIQNQLEGIYYITYKREYACMHACINLWYKQLNVYMLTLFVACPDSSIRLSIVSTYRTFWFVNFASIAIIRDSIPLEFISFRFGTHNRRKLCSWTQFLLRSVSRLSHENDCKLPALCWLIMDSLLSPVAFCNSALMCWPSSAITIPHNSWCPKMCLAAVWYFFRATDLMTARSQTRGVQ